MKNLPEGFKKDPLGYRILLAPCSSFAYCRDMAFLKRYLSKHILARDGAHPWAGPANRIARKYSYAGLFIPMLGSLLGPGEYSCYPAIFDVKHFAEITGCLCSDHEGCRDPYLATMAFANYPDANDCFSVSIHLLRLLDTWPREDLPRLLVEASDPDHDNHNEFMSYYLKELIERGG